MKKWMLGILGASDIAYKRFLPALTKSDLFSFAGIASRDPERCEPFVQKYGGQCYRDYLSLIHDPGIDCVYVPLPPALHAAWGERVLQAGKHLLMEKPFTASLNDTKRLLRLSRQMGLAVHENYMFLYHRQLNRVKELINAGSLGELRMIRTAFTFPFRGADDFRYQKELGGGALLDCGGYPLLLAMELLGPSARLAWSSLHQVPEYGVDTGGSAVLQNSAGLTAHVFFGMNDTYRCELEIWGTKASLSAARIFTAPPDLPIVLYLNDGHGVQEIPVGEDDQFFNSIQSFGRLIENPGLQELRREAILRQGELIDQIQRKDCQRSHVDGQN